MTVTVGPNLGVMVNGASGEAHYAQLMAFMRMVDGAVMPHAKSWTTIVQPVSPTDGDVYIVPVGATGTNWAGQDKKFARWSTVQAAWEFYTPKTGWEILVEDQKDANGTPMPIVYTGSVWAYPAVSLGGITGLKMVWNSGTSLSVTSGSANRPSDGLLMSVAATITKAGLSPAASTWYHVYLFMNGASADIEIVTTAPAAAYNGTARAKTGDTSRRYVGSVKTSAASAIFRFIQAGNNISYLESQGAAPFLLVSAANPTVKTTADCSTLVPITSQLANLSIYNNSPDTDLLIGNDESNAPTPTTYLLFVVKLTACVLPLPIDSSQHYTFCYGSAPTGNCYHRCLGYVYER